MIADFPIAFWLIVGAAFLAGQVAVIIVIAVLCRMAWNHGYDEGSEDAMGVVYKNSVKETQEHLNRI